MRSSAIARCLLVCLIVLAVPGLGRAGIRPSFMLDPSAWKATDIVVAVEAGLADGKVVVLETWKGRLVAKDVLVIPELRRFTGKESRTIKPDPWTQKKDDKPPVVVSGKRMILFLKRASAQPANQETVRIRWEPAGLFHTIEVSVVWVEGEASYSFVQWANPGPSLLTPIDYPEAKMKKKVVEVVQVQESLVKVAAIPAAAERATKAAAYFRSDIFDARM